SFLFRKLRNALAGIVIPPFPPLRDAHHFAQKRPGTIRMVWGLFERLMELLDISPPEIGDFDVSDLGYDDLPAHDLVASNAVRPQINLSVALHEVIEQIGNGRCSASLLLIAEGIAAATYRVPQLNCLFTRRSRIEFRMAPDRVAPLSASGPVGQNEGDCSASGEARAKTANLIVVENAVASLRRFQRFDGFFGDPQPHNPPPVSTPCPQTMRFQ